MKRTKFNAPPKPKLEAKDKKYAGLSAYGGHMPFPPKECPAPNFKTTDETKGKVQWVDMTYCANLCGKRQYCDERKHYNNLRKKGLINV